MLDFSNLSSPKDVVEGEVYSVPFARMKSGFGPDAPILPYPHIDKPEFCLGETPQHVHFDRRFMEDREHLGRDGVVLVAAVEHIESVEMREMICKKSYHSDLLNPFVIAKLYERFRGGKLKDRRCVHNGVLITNKCGTCPAHGMKWNLKTGELQEFKLPFRLAFDIPDMPLGALGTGEIVGGKCRVAIQQDYKQEGLNYRLALIDSEGKVYPGAGMIVEGSRCWNIGDELVVTNTNCWERY